MLAQTCPNCDAELKAEILGGFCPRPVYRRVTTDETIVLGGHAPNHRRKAERGHHVPRPCRHMPWCWPFGYGRVRGRGAFTWMDRSRSEPPVPFGPTKTWTDRNDPQPK